jgi:Transmembrane domain of unknown function (DUF3566)
LDRRTDRPDGSGGGSPTVVTSRATGDDLIGDEQDARTSGIVAPPRRSPQKPDAAKLGPAKSATSDGAASDGAPDAGSSANGAPTAGNGIDRTRNASANGGKDASANGSPAVKDAARTVTDATIADGEPALPADTIRAARSVRPPEADLDQGTAASKAAEQSPGDDSRTGPSRTAASGTAPSGTAPSGRPSAGAGQTAADASAVSAAAFAWEMADPPAESPPSPARNFLRSGISLRGSAPKDSAAPDAAAPKAASPEGPAKAAAVTAAAGEGPVTKRNTGRKGQSKRSARQAHLTIARVEPWSVMKFSFVVSLVAFVILFVAVIVLYGVLSGLGVFDSLQRVVQSVTSSQTSAGVNAKAWFSASKVLGYTALLGSLNIVLITAMSTIGSVVYNLTSRLVGGVEVTLRETE